MAKPGAKWRCTDCGQWVAKNKRLRLDGQDPDDISAYHLVANRDDPCGPIRPIEADNNPDADASTQRAQPERVTEWRPPIW